MYRIRKVFSRNEMKKLALPLLIALGVTVPGAVSADEGGVSFWFPGQYGSLAAVPAEPGWSLPLIYFHTTQDGKGSKEFTKGGEVRLGVEDKVDVLIAAPTYVFATPVFGGQAAVSVAGAYGRVKVDVDATLTGPGGGTLSGRERFAHRCRGSVSLRVPALESWRSQHHGLRNGRCARWWL